MKCFTDPIEAQYYFIDYCDPSKTRIVFENGKYIFTEVDNTTSCIESIEFIGYTDNNIYNTDTNDNIGEYVYDIETEDGTFHAGIGSLIIKNTDSIYTQFTLPDQEKLTEDEKLEKIFEVSQECAGRISETFKKPIELEMEKIMYPCLLFSKKRYVNRYYEKDKHGKIFNSGMDVKGFQIVRRDNCKLVKKIGNAVLDKIMIDKDIEGAKEVARREVKKLLDNDVDINDLTITKSLQSEYKELNINGRQLPKPAHWFLAQKIKERDPGSEPKPGSRVPFIFVENENQNALQSERVEDPDYAIAHPKECRPDMEYYLEKQIATPLQTIFSVLIPNPKTGKLYDIIEKTKINKKTGKEETTRTIPKECLEMIANELWSNNLIKRRNKTRKQSQISDFFNKKK
jgi:DNA polymerase elongation subunit (family B)